MARIPAMTTVLQVGIPGEEWCDDGRRVVSGRVVYDEDPYIDALLVKDALNTTRQIASVIVRGDNNIDAGHIQRPAG
jgi:hypothetical protein